MGSRLPGPPWTAPSPTSSRRWRVFRRAGAAWAPILAPALASTAVGGLAYGVVGLTIVVGVALAVQLAETIVAVADPARGLQDRLAGTCIVPR